ncbi:Saccharopine dehydrogenase [NADP(+), L-glutamate-forming] [Wallemia ichthyophaga EXF-994]|uniref:Saccharopine dehydrogenase [NADP(+), L-glutamate-forming] n=1 Tax=Wallemia ichthyophaga (strain EXF-994 / CBS 113033) TaxID=1299270 RepID=R9AVH2_WALI9|nr:Saccharopine dehydrogenase [NADP(+), L-glutamate-forming] [Wallemia ichthyophaga EXF-994]EOR04106.1 Saccharopine dehydrogenase [NADP(+), L-glutamate-forming] [Wallemia ichthyophaga EXF-994]
MSSPLSHPAIDNNNWFHEISPQWPGQALSLKVNKILHVEKSQFQDVLVFESQSYGNVLVLDGAVQCTERDEFSYQEMITHLPMASHPNPQRVLVIGGGDGGVLREVVKHPQVQEAVLCDIDEAVPRVSKAYLPHMAQALNHEKVTVFIGDGFKFLQDKKNYFDVIITDSSDPEGPAAALFEKAFFELLKNALREGGHISTQGECIWLHLPLIKSLRLATRELFATAEYAYTTIPTYPSGQIGFIVCSKDGSRNLRKPLREVPDCKYYNSKIHQCAFQLPQFADSALNDSRYVAPNVAKAEGEAKKVLLLGSGFVALPAVEYLLRDARNHLTIGCRTLQTAQQMAIGLDRATAVSIDVGNEKALDELVAQFDVVVSLIPYTFHANVIKSAIKGKTHVVTTSYVSPAMKELEGDAKKAGITVMNEIGLDPGLDHLYAVKMFDEVHAHGGKIDTFLSYCGGLPAPESADNPLGYKFSWSSRGVLLALRNTAKFYHEGAAKEVAGPELMATAQPYYISPAFAFVAYPNRDSTPFRDFYSIPECNNLVRGTLRYQGFPEFINALVKLGFLDDSPREYAGVSAPWNTVTAKALGVSDDSEDTLCRAIVDKVGFPSKSEEERILSGLRWIGLFSTEMTTPRGNLLDTLCATLEKKMQYEQGERDMVMLQHKFGIVWADGRKETRTSTLLDYGTPGGYTAMAKLVGVPCGVATQLVLDGTLKDRGIVAPYSAHINKPIMEKLELEGIKLVERTV